MTSTDCPICGEGFSSEMGVRDHTWDLHGACHYCGDAFDDREALYTHWLGDHDDELLTEDRKRAETKVGERTVCPVCRERFASDAAVQAHAWDAHSACHHCGEAFDTEQAMYTHWLARHEEQLTRQHRERAIAEVGPLTFGNRLAHQGPIGAFRNVSLSRRRILAGVGVVAAAGIGGAATGMFESSHNSPPVGNGGTSPGKTAAPAAFTTLDDQEKQLADFRGQKVMFWVFATWCPTCKEGARVLQANNEELQDVTIIALKTYGNAGYSGPSVTEFANQYAPQLVTADNWLWGRLSERSTRVWNPQSRPDIYWLIDKEGMIQAMTAAPAATLNRIVQFAEAENPGGDRPGTSYEIQPAEHIQPGEDHPPYNSNPPTSGWHYPEPAEWGFYDEKLPDERVVHNLEHGGIWISYANVSDDTRQRLRDLTQQYPRSVIVTKRSANDAPIAVASWGQLMKLQSFDRERIVEFIEQNVNHSPEQIAGG